MTGAAINVGNSFTSGERVTYETAPPLTFSSQGIDVKPTDYTTSDSSQYDIVVGQVFANSSAKQCDSSFCNPDGLYTGEKVTYQTSNTDSSKIVGHLTPGGTYYVIVVNPYVIQLAASLEDTQTYSYSCGTSCTTTHNPVPIHITAPAAGGTQEIVPATVTGLTNGDTYVVDSSSTGSSIVLDPAGGGGPIAISSQEVDNRADGSSPTLTVVGGDFHGGQTLFGAGIALSAPGGKNDELRIDMSGGTLPNATNTLLAADGTSLRQLLPPPGDGLTNADAEGGGGGLGSFNTPTRDGQQRRDHEGLRRRLEHHRRRRRERGREHEGQRHRQLSERIRRPDRCVGRRIADQHHEQHVFVRRRRHRLEHDHRRQQLDPGQRHRRRHQRDGQRADCGHELPEHERHQRQQQRRSRRRLTRAARRRT